MNSIYEFIKLFLLNGDLYSHYLQITYVNGRTECFFIFYFFVSLNHIVVIYVLCPCTLDAITYFCLYFFSLVYLRIWASWTFTSNQGSHQQVSSRYGLPSYQYGSLLVGHSFHVFGEFHTSCMLTISLYSLDMSKCFVDVTKDWIVRGERRM